MFVHYHLYRIGKLAVKVDRLLGVQQKDGPAESTPKARKLGEFGLKARAGVGTLGLSGLAGRQGELREQNSSRSQENLSIALPVNYL